MQQLQRGWLLTSQQESNEPFPKPSRPQTEGGSSSGVILTGKPGSPLPLSFGRRRTEGKKGQVSEGAIRHQIPKFQKKDLTEAFNVYNKRSLQDYTVEPLRTFLLWKD